MNKAETIKILGRIKTVYPNFTPNTEEETKMQIEIWQEMFANDSCDIVLQAVNSVITSSEYPPTIAAIKEKINLITKPSELSEIEAWNIYYKAICNSGYNENEEWRKLPEQIKAITSPRQMHDLGQMENDSVMTVEKSNFVRAYRTQIERKKEFDQLPESAKKMREKLLSMCETKQIGE